MGSPVHVILGGTGTLGVQLTERLLTNGCRVRVMARGEHRLAALRARLDCGNLSVMTGDVRDLERLRMVLTGAEYVYHLAALKHVHTCEYDVLEAVHTNIDGTANVVRACVDSHVKRAVLVSTDKAVEPTTTYGATKLMAERIFIHGNSYSAGRDPQFYCVRYGNVLGSQGSVVELWRSQAEAGVPLTVSDPHITRFWWTPSDAATFVQESMLYSRPGDVLVPLMSACSIGDLAGLVSPMSERTTVPTYGTEKTDEVLLAPHEASKASYVHGLNAVRVSCLHSMPEDELAWAGGRLVSRDCVSVDGVGRILSQAGIGAAS